MNTYDIFERNIDPILIEYLLENDALNQFIRALEEQGGSIDRHIKDINMAFTWAKTPEGDVYWRDLHNNFRNYIL
jgi:hypothetical protein